MTEPSRFLSVSRLTAQIRQVLEPAFAQVAVRGEVANLRRPPSGHCYFTIKDAHAALKAVIWRSTLARLRVLPEEGKEFGFIGDLSIYDARGEYQLIVARIEPVGIGAWAAEFERRRQQFKAAGLFDNQRPLPPWPKRIAVVTSPEAAAWRDVRKVLASRPGWLEILLSPCLVQGEQAPASIARAIGRAASAKPDLVLVVRGGGSLEDLWCFNEERVVRAIHACPVPVITGIGHETDTTLADFAADERAATPSQAAEKVCPPRAELKKRIPARTRLTHALVRIVQQGRTKHGHLIQRFGKGMQHLLTQHRMKIDDCLRGMETALHQMLHDHRRRLRNDERTLLAHQPAKALHRQREKLLRLMARLSAGYERHASGLRARVRDRHTRLTGIVRQWLPRQRGRVGQLRETLKALGPEQVLARGYLLCEGEDGRLRTRVNELSLQEHVRLRFYDGRAHARIEKVETR